MRNTMVALGVALLTLGGGGSCGEGELKESQEDLAACERHVERLQAMYSESLKEIERLHPRPPCEIYATIIATKANDCPEAMGGLKNLKAQTYNCQAHVAKLNVERCRREVTELSCKHFAEGDFIYACFRIK